MSSPTSTPAESSNATETWTNPADVLRAKILNQLNCGYCEHFYGPEVAGWCTKLRDDPCPGESGKNTYCHDFQRKERKAVDPPG